MRLRGPRKLAFLSTKRSFLSVEELRAGSCWNTRYKNCKVRRNEFGARITSGRLANGLHCASARTRQALLEEHTLKFKIVAIGEVLWDLLPTGKQLGGAPANFAYHAHALGADSSLITRVGADEFGQLVLERFRQQGLPITTVAVDSAAPTGTVSVELGVDGIPNYVIHEHVAWDRITADEPGLTAVSVTDAVCFGTLAQRTEPARRAIRTLVGAAPASALRVLDINLRPPFFTHEVIEGSLAIANVLKLNDHELAILAEWFSLKGDPREQIMGLARQFDLKVVALTRGPNGSLLFEDGKWSDHPGLPVSVEDTIGAGDAFGAAMTLGLLRRYPLDTINRQANDLAAFVCTKRGATPTLPEKLRLEITGPDID